MQIVKNILIGICFLLLPGCLTQSERFARLTSEDIEQWTDDILCKNGYRDNPAIKSELLRRKLLTEQEFDYVMLSNIHNNFPKKGMSKCAMWKMTNGSELIKQTTMHDGSKTEIWKVHHGEYFVSKSIGGNFFLITIENGQIKDISAPLN